MAPQAPGLFDDGEAKPVADPLEARKKAMDYLARREYGCKELCAKLVSGGFDEQTALSAVEQLAREGLQDDRRFIDSFIQSRVHQGKGPVRLRLELAGRGIDGAMVAQVLEERCDDWGALAQSVRRRKFGASAPRDFREKARQMRFLQYRGFEQDQIQAAIAGDHDD